MTIRNHAPRPRTASTLGLVALAWLFVAGCSSGEKPVEGTERGLRGLPSSHSKLPAKPTGPPRTLGL